MADKVPFEQERKLVSLMGQKKEQSRFRFEIYHRKSSKITLRKINSGFLERKQESSLESSSNFHIVMDTEQLISWPFIKKLAVRIVMKYTRYRLI